MAQRRMISKDIIHNDAFTRLPPKSQALYMHLCLCADDDGFCLEVTACMLRAHAGKADLQNLLTGRFLLRFPSGAMVIKHWRKMNTLRVDRYKPTIYAEEKELLRVKADGTYTFEGGEPIPEELPFTPPPEPPQPRQARKNAFHNFAQRTESLNDIMYTELR